MSSFVVSVLHKKPRQFWERYCSAIDPKLIGYWQNTINITIDFVQPGFQGAWELILNTCDPPPTK